MFLFLLFPLKVYIGRYWTEQLIYPWGKPISHIRVPATPVQIQPTAAEHVRSWQVMVAQTLDLSPTPSGRLRCKFLFLGFTFGLAQSPGWCRHLGCESIYGSIFFSLPPPQCVCVCVSAFKMRINNKKSNYIDAEKKWV